MPRWGEESGWDERGRWGDERNAGRGGWFGRERGGDGGFRGREEWRDEWSARGRGDESRRDYGRDYGEDWRDEWRGREGRWEDLHPGERRTYRGRGMGGHEEWSGGEYGREGYGREGLGRERFGRGEDWGWQAGRGGREWERDRDRGFGGRGEYDEYGGMGGRGREAFGFRDYGGGAYAGGGAYRGGAAYGRSGGGLSSREEGWRGGEWREGRGEEEGGGMMDRLKSGMRKLTGKGPKGYRRSDDRIRDEVSERIARSWIDADDVEVSVKDGEVTLSGTVTRREDKRSLEDLADDVFGVEEVHDHLRVRREGQHGMAGTQPGASATQAGVTGQTGTTGAQTGTTAGQTGQRPQPGGTAGQRGTQPH